jgi:ribosome-associated protein
VSDTESVNKTPPKSFADRQERNLQLALAAARAVHDNRGRDILLLDMRELTAIFDFFVIATGTSQRQLRAMSDGVQDVLEKQLGDKHLSIEGYQDSKWILCDYGTVVVHLFDEDSRKFYRLEELWAGAKSIDLTAILI